MKKPHSASDKHGEPALLNRRKFLKRALLTVAYATPVLVSYSSTVFAAHCSTAACGGGSHMNMGMVWSPGCSQIG